MDPKDLLKMLDLDGKPPRPPASPCIASDELDSTHPRRMPTALEVDAWGLRRGRDLVAESERLRTFDTDEFAAADFFAAAFEPDPRLRESCVDPRRHEFLAQLLDTPEYRALHAATRLDDTAAGDRRRPLRRAVRRPQAGGPTAAGGARSPRTAMDRGRWRRCGPSAGRWPRPARRWANCTRRRRRSGWGRGRRGPTTRGPSPRCSSGSAATRRCGGSATWPAGSGGWRSRSSGRRRRTGWTTWSASNPAATSAGCCPPSWPSWRSRSWNSTPCAGSSSGRPCAASTTPSSPSARGRSSSSWTSAGRWQGEKAHTAKALALALAWVARQQRRWCGLVAYSGDIGRAAAGPAAGPVGRGAAAGLARGVHRRRVATSTCPSGSCPGCTAELKAPPGVTDVVFVTDARCRIPAEVRDRVPRLEAAGAARLVTLVIDNPPGDLAAVSDEVHPVRSLAPDADAVGRVLSL